MIEMVMWEAPHGALGNSLKHQWGNHIWVSATEGEPTASHHWAEGLSINTPGMSVSSVCLTYLHAENKRAGSRGGCPRTLCTLSSSSGGTSQGWESRYGHCTEVRLKFQVRLDWIKLSIPQSDGNFIDMLSIKIDSIRCCQRIHRKIGNSTEL